MAGMEEYMKEFGLEVPAEPPPPAEPAPPPAPDHEGEGGRYVQDFGEPREAEQLVEQFRKQSAARTSLPILILHPQSSHISFVGTPPLLPCGRAPGSVYLYTYLWQPRPLHPDPSAGKQPEDDSAPCPDESDRRTWRSDESAGEPPSPALTSPASPNKQPFSWVPPRAESHLVDADDCREEGEDQGEEEWDEEEWDEEEWDEEEQEWEQGEQAQGAEGAGNTAHTPGTVVILDGFESRTDLNRQQSTIQSYDQEQALYAVKVDGSGEDVLVDPAKTCVVHSPGTAVILDGFESRKDLNGKQAKVQFYDREQARYAVQVDTGEDVLVDSAKMSVPQNKVRKMSRNPSKMRRNPSKMSRGASKMRRKTSKMSRNPSKMKQSTSKKSLQDCPHPCLLPGPALGKDGWAVSSGEDGVAILWDYSDGNQVQLLKGHSAGILSVAISGDRKCILTAGADATCKVWDSESGTLVHTLIGHEGSVTAVAVSNSKLHVVTVGEDHMCKVWNLATGKELLTWKANSSGQIWSTAISHDGRFVATGGGDTACKVWTLDTGILLDTLTGHSDWVWAVVFTPDDRYLVSASEDKTVRVWDVSTGTLVRCLEGHSGAVLSVAISPDGSRLLSAGEDTTCKVWDTTTWEIVHTLTGHRNRIRAVAVSHDNRFALTGSEDKTCMVFNISTGQHVQTLPGHAGEVWCLSLPNKGLPLNQPQTPEPTPAEEAPSPNALSPTSEPSDPKSPPLQPTVVAPAPGQSEMRKAETGLTQDAPADSEGTLNTKPMKSALRKSSLTRNSVRRASVKPLEDRCEPEVSLVFDGELSPDEERQHNEWLKNRWKRKQSTAGGMLWQIVAAHVLGPGGKEVLARIAAAPMEGYDDKPPSELGDLAPGPAPVLKASRPAQGQAQKEVEPRIKYVYHDPYAALDFAASSRSPCHTPMDWDQPNDPLVSLRRRDWLTAKANGNTSATSQHALQQQILQSALKKASSASPHLSPAPPTASTNFNWIPNCQQNMLAPTLGGSTVLPKAALESLESQKKQTPRGKWKPTRLRLPVRGAPEEVAVRGRNKMLQIQSMRHLRRKGLALKVAETDKKVASLEQDEKPAGDIFINAHNVYSALFRTRYHGSLPDEADSKFSVQWLRDYYLRQQAAADSDPGTNFESGQDVPKKTVYKKATTPCANTQAGDVQAADSKAAASRDTDAPGADIQCTDVPAEANTDTDSGSSVVANVANADHSSSASNHYTPPSVPPISIAADCESQNMPEDEKMEAASIPHDTQRRQSLEEGMRRASYNQLLSNKVKQLPPIQASVPVHSPLQASTAAQHLSSPPPHPLPHASVSFASPTTLRLLHNPMPAFASPSQHAYLHSQHPVLGPGSLLSPPFVSSMPLAVHHSPMLSPGLVPSSVPSISTRKSTRRSGLRRTSHLSSQLAGHLRSALLSPVQPATSRTLSRNTFQLPDQQVCNAFKSQPEKPGSTGMLANCPDSGAFQTSDSSVQSITTGPPVLPKNLQTSEFQSACSSQEVPGAITDLGPSITKSNTARLPTSHNPADSVSNLTPPDIEDKAAFVTKYVVKLQAVVRGWRVRSGYTHKEVAALRKGWAVRKAAKIHNVQPISQNKPNSAPSGDGTATTVNPVTNATANANLVPANAIQELAVPAPAAPASVQPIVTDTPNVSHDVGSPQYDPHVSHVTEHWKQQTPSVSAPNAPTLSSLPSHLAPDPLSSEVPE
eukprot:gene9471-1703_t